MPEIPQCFWCVRSEVFETFWERDKEGFWRCSFGHLANITQVDVLEKSRKEKLDKRTTLNKDA